MTGAVISRSASACFTSEDAVKFDIVKWCLVSSGHEIILQKNSELFLWARNAYWNDGENNIPASVQRGRLSSAQIPPAEFSDGWFQTGGKTTPFQGGREQKGPNGADRMRVQSTQVTVNGWISVFYLWGETKHLGRPTNKIEFKGNVMQLGQQRLKDFLQIVE